MSDFCNSSAAAVLQPLFCNFSAAPALHGLFLQFFNRSDIAWPNFAILQPPQYLQPLFCNSSAAPALQSLLLQFFSRSDIAEPSRDFTGESPLLARLLLFDFIVFLRYFNFVHTKRAFAEDVGILVDEKKVFHAYI